MKVVGLGLKDGEVRLAPSVPQWKRAYSTEAYQIFDWLRLESLRLYFIGSASVPGLVAKPVLDILGCVYSLAELDAVSHRLEGLGYESLGEYGIPGRRYFRLRSEDGIDYVHLHLFEESDPKWTEHLRFRDSLLKDEELRGKYATAKVQAAEVAQNRDDYQQRKAQVIKEILAKAIPEARKAVAVLGAAEGHGNTLAYLQEAYDGWDLKIHDLNSVRVEPYSYRERRQDDFFRIIDDALAADRLVIATPVYWYAMSGAMKDFLDRFSDLMGGPGKTRGEALFGKKVEILVSGYDHKLPFGFEVPVAATCLYFAMDYLGARYRANRH